MNAEPEHRLPNLGCLWLLLMNLTAQIHAHTPVKGQEIDMAFPEAAQTPETEAEGEAIFLP